MNDRGALGFLPLLILSSRIVMMNFEELIKTPSFNNLRIFQKKIPAYRIPIKFIL